MKIINTCHCFIKYILISILLLSSTLEAQEQKQQKLKFRHKIVISPINLANIYDPKFNLAYDYLLKKNLSVQVEMGLLTKRSFLGLLTYIFNGGDIYLKTYSGYNIKSEMKYHIIDRTLTFSENKITPGKTRYIAVEVFHNNVHCECIDNINGFDSTTVSYDIKSSSGNYYDKYEVSRTLTGLHFKLGITKTIRNGFYFNFYTGLGLAYRNSKQADREYYDDRSDTFLEFSQSNYLNREGKSFVITLPLNFKIGWSL